MPEDELKKDFLMCSPIKNLKKSNLLSRKEKLGKITLYHENIRALGGL